MSASSATRRTSTQTACTTMAASANTCRQALLFAWYCILADISFHTELLNPAVQPHTQVKNRKLHEQFEELAAAAGGTGGGVFAGVNLFVNGFTIPSHLVRASLN